MIASAAELMYVRGVNAVTLDDVRAATGTSKSQLYKHFPGGKPELVRAVVAPLCKTVPMAVPWATWSSKLRIKTTRPERRCRNTSRIGKDCWRTVFGA